MPIPWIDIVAPVISLIVSVFVLYGYLSSPVKHNRETIRDLQKRVEGLEKCVQEETEQIQHQEALNRMILEALSALCKHGETGNSTGKLKQCSDKIDNYLFEKGGKM